MKEFNMESYLDSHFNIQQGMFFDRIYKNGQFTYYGSDLIEDSIWNYGQIADNNLTEQNIVNYGIFCESIQKPANLYLIENSSKVDKNLLLKYYTEVSQESWYKFKECKYTVRPYKVMPVQTEKQKSDFIEVFVSAYGGEKTIEKPYGDLSHCYVQALERTFFQSKRYAHFICYNSLGCAVSIATLCYKDGIGGIYSVGTKKGHEKNGYGLATTDACIQEWKKRGGSTLFLQTETGTGIDKWYESMGFDFQFYGKFYEKRS